MVRLFLRKQCFMPLPWTGPSTTSEGNLAADDLGLTPLPASGTSMAHDRWWPFPPTPELRGRNGHHIPATEWLEQETRPGSSAPPHQPDLTAQWHPGWLDGRQLHRKRSLRDIRPTQAAHHDGASDRSDAEQVQVSAANSWIAGPLSCHDSGRVPLPEKAAGKCVRMPCKHMLLASHTINGRL